MEFQQIKDLGLLKLSLSSAPLAPTVEGKLGV